MAKLLKILGKIFLGLLEWVLIVIFLFALAIRSSSFQTYSAQKVTEFLSAELDAEIRIDKIDISFFDKVFIQGIFVEDHHKDTLASIGEIAININALELNKLVFTLDNVALKNARINLKKYKEEDHLNIQYLVDYFKPKEKDDKKVNFVIASNALQLENVDFSFIDENKDLNAYGMDFDHLHFKNTQLDIQDLVFTPKGLVATFNRLSTHEAYSNFKLTELSGKAKHSSEGIFFTDFKVLTDETELTAEVLDLKTYTYANYQNFVDSVDFNVDIKNSKVSLKDISIFAPQLKGMNDHVFLDVKASQRIKDLKLDDIYLKFGQSSYLAGDFVLPDFRVMDSLVFDELINDFYITLKDVESISLPESAGETRIVLPENVKRFDYVNGTNVAFVGGVNDFKIKAKNIRTALGTVEIEKDLNFVYKASAYHFGEYSDSSYYLNLLDFKLGEFLGQESFGIAQGSFAIKGKASGFSSIEFTDVSGEIDRFDFNKYAYSKIKISKASLIGKEIYANLKMNDANLDLDFDGIIDFSDEEKMRFALNLNESHLERLNLSITDSTVFSTQMQVDVANYTKENIGGSIQFSNLHYGVNKDTLDLEKMDLKATRSSEGDLIVLNSPYFDAEFKGVINYTTLVSDVDKELRQLLPNLYLKDSLTVQTKNKQVTQKVKANNFTYNVVIKEAQDLLDVFIPELALESNTSVKGVFNAKDDDFELSIFSPSITYDNLNLKNLDLNQYIWKGNANVNATADMLSLNDTINCNDVLFTAFNYKESFDTQLSWNPGNSNPTSFSFYTHVNSPKDITFEIKTSYFTVRDHKWDIRKDALIAFRGDSIMVDDFRMTRMGQYLKLDGLLTNDVKDKLDIDIKDLDLADFSGLIGGDFQLNGKTNIDGKLATPFTDLFFSGNGNIDSLYINNEEVGNISLYADYSRTKQKIDVNGKIDYRGLETFDFDGIYDLAKEADNLDFDLKFDRADLGVTNAFLNPEVVSGIAGKINGEIKVSGEIDAPKLKGKVDLEEGNAKLQLLGANFKFKGEIEVDENGVYLNNMPITDEEGNVGSVVGQVFHDNFSNFNFDLSFDLEEFRSNGRRYPVDRFLVMNTRYDPDEYYYGKAYVRGTANISGYADNMRIEVNAETQRGTWVDFPMYGASEIEEVKFIEWLPKEIDSTASDEPKIDFTGVDMNLNIAVTPETRLKVIFNETIDDEILAFGSGDINIGLDNYNQLSMEGIFTVDRGSYNFAMGPYKQNFTLVKGGTVQWTGSPYDASIDLGTYYKTNANLDVLVSETLGNTGNRNDEVFCYLDLKGDLLKPDITFDIKAPQASELGRATLARVRSDQDELNKQFFSLLVLKQFRPLYGGGSGAGGGSLGLDLVSTQINSVINKFNTGANIGVALDRDEFTGENSVEVGFSKEFLNDKLIVSTSFGVENNTRTDDESANNLIGDVKVEYIINEPRTLRVNVYNESNDYSVIQDNNQGQFTQGVGLHYQEDFQNLSDFKLFQYIGNLFRKEEDKKKKNSNKKKIPQEYIDDPGLLREDETNSEN